MTHHVTIVTTEKGPYNTGFPGEFHYASCECGWNSVMHDDYFHAFDEGLRHAVARS